MENEYVYAVGIFYFILLYVMSYIVCIVLVEWYTSLYKYKIDLIYVWSLA